MNTDYKIDHPAVGVNEYSVDSLLGQTIHSSGILTKTLRLALINKDIAFSLETRNNEMTLSISTTSHRLP